MARDWCFTAWEKPNPNLEAIKYMIYGSETCPTSGKFHFQGFAVFCRTCRIPKAKEWIGAGQETHLEPRRGTRSQASEYCKKDGDFVELGVLECLTSSDILKLDINRIKEEWPLMYCQYHRGIEKLNQRQGEKWRRVDVTVLWGATGTGKTREVMEKEDVFKIDPPYNWWDGYSGENILLIDDYSNRAIPRGMLLNLLDGYRLRLETKGGHTYALWSQVYITCNLDPVNWDDALLRRVTCVRAMGNTVP